MTIEDRPENDDTSATEAPVSTHTPPLADAGPVTEEPPVTEDAPEGAEPRSEEPQAEEVAPVPEQAEGDQVPSGDTASIEAPAPVEEASGEAPEEVPSPEAETETETEEAPPEPEVAEPEVAEPEVAKPEEPAAEAASGNGAEPSEDGAADPFSGPGEWYVVHTYAGYENKVRTNLQTRIQTMQMQDKIFDVFIPMEDVMEIKGGKKQVVKKKTFPGYLLVKMVYDDDSWVCVRNTPGVTGFVSAGSGQRPTPLSRRDVEKILTVQEEDVKKPALNLEFAEGDVVRIIAGPFADFNGTISDINVDQSKVRVMVNIFDRETPVELSFDQVAKV